MNNKKNIDFFWVWIAKCWTSYFAKLLEEHPEIYLVPWKEVWFFHKTDIFENKEIKSKLETKWINEYYKMYDWSKKTQKLWEWSWVNILDNYASNNIKKYFPNSKILVALRNPIDRAISHYYYSKFYTLEDKKSNSFMDWLKKYPQVYIGLWQYYKLLKKYYDIFDKKNIKVIIFEDFIKNPNKNIRELYSFLEVNENFIPTSLNKKVNKTVKLKNKSIKKIYYYISKISIIFKKLRVYFIINFLRKLWIEKLINYLYNKFNIWEIKKEKLSKKDREYLLNFFIEDIENLENFLNINLSKWKN